MGGYYEDRLSGAGLQKCYAIAPPRIRQYLDAELRFVVDQVQGAELILELGCGYGRVLKTLSPDATRVVGCDTSRKSLELARSYVRPRRNIALVRTDAARTAFPSDTFDAVVCIQNGISAFGIDPRILGEEAVRVTKPGGRILFSSYSPRIWDERLDWFRKQARAGLLGQIDESRTGKGTIVCQDGFRATTVDGSEFKRLFLGLGRTVEVLEIDESSVFCIVLK